MSGGSMDYFYSHLEDAADKFILSTIARIAVRSHMLKLAKALRAIEWNDSGDGDDQEEELINDCLAPKEVLVITIPEAKRVLRELAKEVKRYEGDISIQTTRRKQRVHASKKRK